MKTLLWLMGLIALVAACASPVPPPTATPTATIAPTTPVATEMASVKPTATITSAATPTADIPNPSGLIAYAGVANDDYLFVVNLDGTGRVTVAGSHGTGPLHSVALSPDGHQVLYVAGYGSTQIQAANTDGSGIRSLTEEAIGGATWSPDGQNIAYTAFDSTGLHRIYLMGKDGSNKRLLTAGSGYKEYSATWSPRGDRIAFTAEISRPLENGGGMGYLRVVNIDGTHEMTLTAEVENISSPEWSPSGQWIAYTGWSDIRKAKIFHLTSPDGSRMPEPKVDGYSHLLYPVWSPDGTRVVFAAQPVDLPNELHLILMNIPDLTWIKLAEKVDQFERCWTSDGDQILYRVLDIKKGTIWAIKPDGTEAHQLPETIAGLDDCIPK